MDYPFVSVIVPCRNEDMFISDCLKSLLSNDYPKEKIEVLVVDGNSSDQSRKIIDEFAEKNSCVNILENPQIIFPAAVNIGIKSAKGELIIIAGAHARYPKNYISSCASYSIRYNADNIGGVLETLSVNDNFTGRLITKVLSSPFGVGNSKFRTGSSEIIETDTVFGGCYKKEVFVKHGLFNEKLISTSDFEFNSRIRKAGAKILLVPEIKTFYYTRTSYMKFVRNNIRNGFWAIFPISVTNHFPVSVRHLIPLVFVLALVISACLSFFSGFFFLAFLAIMVSYLFICIVYSIRASGKNFLEFLMMPLIFISLHLSYGIGSISGIIKVVQKKLKNN